jgi:hypothetical protein
VKKVYTVALFVFIASWSMAQCPPGVLPYLVTKNITVCPGQTTVNLNITAGNLSAYQLVWDSPAQSPTSGWIPANGNQFQAQVIIPPGTGASAPVTIKGVFSMSYPGGGCESTDTIKLRVGYPGIAAISPVVCIGTTSASITFSPAGAIAADSYLLSWSVNAYNAGLRNSSGALTGSSFPVSTVSGLPPVAGTYSGNLYVVGNSAYQSSPNCTSPAIPVSVTIRALPVASITGVHTICPGATALLTASSASSYLWSTGATTPAINAGPGNYTVLVRDNIGCISLASSAFSVSAVTPTASISSSASAICAAGPTILTANSGNSWLWSTGATTQQISASTAGTYTVTVTNYLGCSATSSPVSLGYDPNPYGVINRNSNLCYSGFEWLDAGSGSNYSWGAPFKVIYTAGHYDVTYTNTSGCPVSAEIDIQCEGGGYEWRVGKADKTSSDKPVDPLEGKFAVYPNPVNYELRLHLPRPVVELVEVRLLDMMGTVHVQASMTKDEVEKIIATKDLLPGMYLLQIQGEKMNRVRNVVVRH